MGKFKAALTERVQHSNRIKGLLFGQGISGYEPLRPDCRQRLGELQTADGRPLRKRGLKATLRILAYVAVAALIWDGPWHGRLGY